MDRKLEGMDQLLRLFRDDRRFAVEVAVGTVVIGLVMALPTVLIPNPVFGRMIDAEWWHYASWIASTPLLATSVALYRRRTCPIGRTAAGGFMTVFAVGCPTCNALVVAALGTSGALSFFAPLQPFLGFTAVALLLLALRSQLRNARTDEGEKPFADSPGRPSTP